MLAAKEAMATIAVKDIAKAKKFYGDTLGLKQLDQEMDEVATYQSGKSTLNVYQSEFAGTNKGTAALWEVDDVEATVKELKSKGATFIHYDDMPGMTREGDVHRAGPIKVAWLTDPAVDRIPA